MAPPNNSTGAPLGHLCNLQWGAHPEVLEGTFVDEEEEPEQINEIPFTNVYSLWGEGVPSADSLDDDESTNIAPPPIDSVTQLWSDIPDDIDYDNDGLDISAFAGLEWWDQVTEDGSLRKSYATRYFK